MTQVQTTAESHPTSKGQDPLDRIRAAAQALHGALSDAAAKRGDSMKDDLQAIPRKAEAIMASIKESLGVQSEATKKHLAEAVTFLAATEKHIAEGLKTTGRAFETSVRQAVANAHAATQKVSEAVAAKRTAESTHSHS